MVAAIAVLMVPGLYFTGNIPMTVQSEGFAHIMGPEEAYNKSIIVAEGTIIREKTELTFVENGIHQVPYVYTTWTLETSDVIKGEGKKIKFKTSGGTYNKIEHISLSGPHFEKGQEVIVFLSKDPPGTMWGDSYYLTGIASGLYKITPEGTNGLVSEPAKVYNELRDVEVNLSELKNQLRSLEG